MQQYRTKLCGELRAADAGKTVRLAGWIYCKRNHGRLLFVDLRDNDGVTQCVLDVDSPLFATVEKTRVESVVSIEGKVLLRDEKNRNTNTPTGEVEVAIEKITILSEAEKLPLQITADPKDLSEERRLEYRYLDLRRHKPHANILLRSAMTQFIREKMWSMKFHEFQTPILTASSPEGARDFLVPSRLHKGKFYALPQAPQLFKQLLMISGFDKYFQIAPCFRDEDARADRTPGEFYQIDIEMSFVTQDEIFEVGETLMTSLFQKFAPNSNVSATPFEHIPYKESLLKYGTDKPDLRNPLIIQDVSDIFAHCEFELFSKQLQNGGFVRAIKTPHTAGKPRSWFDKVNAFAVAAEMGGVGYISLAADGIKGSIAKRFSPDEIAALTKKLQLQPEETIFFICGKGALATKFSGNLRDFLGEELGLIEKDAFRFCWITDFPFYEKDEETGSPAFFHNPFSMPQGEMDALLQENVFDIKAYQFDMVCNGYEILSGAIRNHRPDIMFKAFEIAGYNNDVVKEKFAGLFNAFQYGAPPHGGCAFGLDRLVMLISNEEYIREVIVFPLTQGGEDLMMKAPTEVSEKQLRELHIKLR